MDNFFITVYGDDGKVLFSKSGEDQFALVDLVQNGIIKNEVYRTQLKATYKYKEIRVVVEERCSECGVMHPVYECQEIL